MSSAESHYSLHGYAADVCKHKYTYDDGICSDCGFDTTTLHSGVTPEQLATDPHTVTGSTTSIPTILYNQLNYLGLIPTSEREHNIGTSDYATKLIQPWSIFLDNPQLNYMECVLIKRILRTKSTDSRKLDLEKCHHIISELLRQNELEQPND